MGFSHYWYKKQELSQKKWDKFTDIVKLLYADNEVASLIAYEDSSPKPAEASDSLVRFNGKGDDGFETFYFDRVATSSVKENGLYFNCCKTSQYPYDVVVVAVLILAKLIFQKDIKIRSDGELSDWREGLMLIQRAFSTGLKVTQDEEGDFCVNKEVTILSEEDFLKTI